MKSTDASAITLPVAVRSVDELLDPGGSPLLGPRIHPDVADAIRSLAEREPRHAHFVIEITVPAGEVSRAGEVEQNVRHYFQEQESRAAEELRELRRKGLWSVFVALLIVTVFIGLSEAVMRLGEGRMVRVLSESLIIISWVTLWGPAETLLFARFPIQRQRHLSHALSLAPVNLRAA